MSNLIFDIMRRFPFLMILFVMFAGCTGRGTDDEQRPVATVSIEPQRWLLAQIAGDRFEIRSLMDRNADPENFDPTLSALRDVERGMVYFTLGNNAFEESTVGRLRDNGSKLRIVDTSEGIDFIRGTHSHAGKEGAESPDPHVWLSVENMRRMAVNMERALAEIDSANAEYYGRRLDSLMLSLDSLDRELADRMAPWRGKAFLVWHPALSYFARDYGLKQIALGSEGKEATPAHLAASISEARDAGVRVLIMQPGDDPQRSMQMARGVSADTASITALDYDWRATMLGIADAFTRSRNARSGCGNDRREGSCQ